MKNHVSLNSLNRRAVLGAAMAAAAPLSFGQAAAYPSRPVRIVVGYAAGGGIDTMARILAQRLSPLLGQAVIVENRAGAAGMIAADNVAKAPADGYSLIYGESAMLITPQLQKTQFEPLKVLTPVASLFQSRLMIVASNNVPANTPQELIALLRNNPGKYSYGTSGVGTVHHLGFELLKSLTGAYVIHIPYRGASQIVPDVINGELAIGVVSTTAALPHLRSGRLKVIASMSSTIPGVDGINTVSQALPGFDVGPRQFLMATSGTPAPVIARLGEAIRQVLDSPELAQAAAQQGVMPAYLDAPGLTAALAREQAEWGKVIRTQKIVAV